MHPRRRLFIGILIVALVVAIIPALWIGAKWQRTVANVDKMIVTPVVLPTATAAPTPIQPTKVVSKPEIPTPIPTAIPVPDGALNILLLGTDARVGEDISRTDTLVLVHLDPVSNHVSMLSFPRDLWVDIPGYGKNRINAAYTIGEKKLGAGYGPALLKETVSELVGLPIDHFVLINFEGFRTLIDKIGGITIDVPKVINDNKYPMDEYTGDVRTMKVHFDAGPQFMDGDQALIYARTRHADSDFGRNQRQQQVLMAIFDQVRSQGMLSQLANIDEYTDVLSEYVRTDLSRSDMLGLAGMARNLNEENIQRYAIDSAMVVEERLPADVLVLRDQKELKRIISQMIDPTVTARSETPAR